MQRNMHTTHTSVWHYHLLCTNSRWRTFAFRPQVPARSLASVCLSASFSAGTFQRETSLHREALLHRTTLQGNGYALFRPDNTLRACPKDQRTSHPPPYCPSPGTWYTIVLLTSDARSYSKLTERPLGDHKAALVVIIVWKRLEPFLVVGLLAAGYFHNGVSHISTSDCSKQHQTCTYRSV